MEFDLVFNEISVQNIDANAEIAKQWMSELIKTIRAFTAQGVKVNIRSHESFYHITLAPNYSISQWCKEASEKERRFIKTLSKKTPLSQDLFNTEIQEIENHAGLSEFYYQGQLTIGLSIAYLLDTVAISFISEPCWDLICIKLDAIQLDMQENIVNQTLEIRHASRNIHVQDHAEWIQRKIQEGIVDGTDIWSRREELFPNLEFCDSVCKQLENIRSGQLELRPVYKNLIEIQKCCQNWISGTFSVEGYSLDESGESESTRNNNRYRQERTFMCPDGEERFFERHIKLRSCNWRIHFFPLQPGKVIIGYIGRHLPTVNYRT